MKQYKDWQGTASMFLGIASIFLFETIIIPIASIALGIISLAKSKQERTDKIAPIVGITLGTLYLIVAIYIYTK